MKKSIIALAVAAGSFAGIAQADGTTLYGSVRMAYEYDSKGAVSDGKEKSTSKFGDNGSRFGIKGSDDLGNGLEAFYKYENRVGGGDAKTHKLYAGLKGAFGTVSLGMQNTPRDDLSNYSDPTNQFETDYGRNALTRTDNSAAYITPDMGGFSFQAAVVADGAGNQNRHVDAYDVLAKYEANGFYAGLGYQSTTPKDDTTAAERVSSLGLGLGYGNDQFEIGLLAEKDKHKDAELDPVFVRLGGLYNVTPMDAVYASISYHDSDVDDTKKTKGATVGYQHKFSKRTRVWAEYGYRSKGTHVDGPNSVVTNDKASNKFGLGLRTDF